MKRIISFIIVAVMLTTAVFAAERTFEEPAADKLNIVIDGGLSAVEAAAGKEVAVCIKLINNVTISSLKLKLTYDEKLSVVKSASGKPKINIDIRDPEDSTSMIDKTVDEEERIIKLNWVSGEQEVTGDCTYATITFKVAEDAEPGSFLPITVSSINPNDVFDINTNNIDFNIINGGIDVVDYTPGDVDGDGLISNRDIIMLSRYLGGSTPEGFILIAADYNEDKAVDAKDLEALFEHVCAYTYTLPDTEYSYGEVPEGSLGIVVDGSDDSYKAVIGKDVKVRIRLVHNTGVSSIKTVLYWSELLTLTDAKYDIYDEADTSACINTAEDWSAVGNSFAFNWASGNKEVKDDVTFVTLTFTMPEDIEEGKFLYVALTADNIFNASGSELKFVYLSGGVDTKNVVVGDPTDDGQIDNKDVVTVFRYVSTATEETDNVMDAASDFDGNGEVNNKDVVALFRFVSTKRS